MKGIAVHAFRVVPLDPKRSTSVETLLDRIHKQQIPDRIRVVGQTEVRLEDLVKRNGYYLMDFTRLRFESGPGRASRSKPITGFQFEKGEGFGEETAALYDPTSNHMIVQYNHHGVRSGRIAEYLGRIDDEPDNQYTLETRFDEHIERKLAKKSIMRKLHFRVAPHHITLADKKAGNSLTKMVSAGNDYNAETIDVTVAVRRGRQKRGLRAETVRQTLSVLQRWMGIDADSVLSLEVGAQEDPDDKVEVLNLLGHRLKQTFTDLKVDADLRYPQHQRWYALERALNGWRATLKK